MSECKLQVEITMRAAVLDVTPEGGGGASLEDGTGALPEDGPSAGDGDPAEEASAGEAPADEGSDALAKAAAVADSGDSALTEAAGDIDIGLAEVEGGPTAEADRAGTEEGTLTMAEADPALVAEGESLFRQCQACHQVGEGAKNRTGPHLNGVIGRAAGDVEDFRYSKAMDEAGEAGLVWDAVSLSEFLADPRGYLKGTKMTFRGLPEDEIPAMLAYLGSLNG